MQIIILPVLAVGFAAFCIWLTVRTINRRESWAKWAAAGLILLVIAGYPLSTGPVYVFSGILRLRSTDLDRIYSPITWISRKSEFIDYVVWDWYVEDVWQDRFVSLWLECFGEDT